MKVLAQATFAYRYKKAEHVGVFELAIGGPLKRRKWSVRDGGNFVIEGSPPGVISVRIRRLDRRQPKKRRWFLRWTGKRFCVDRDRERLPPHVLEWAKKELEPRSIGADWGQSVAVTMPSGSVEPLRIA